MFSQPIVFVVGAGASAEFGLPTSAAMNASIALALRFAHGAVGEGDRSMFDMLGQQYGTDSPKYHEAAAELARRINEFASVDEALHWYSHRPEVVSLGKAEIIRQILLAEARSKLFNAQDLNFIRESKYESEWLPPLFSMAVGSMTKQTASNIFRNVTVINFNYDRTIEHFLYSRFQTNLGLTEAEAKEVVSGLTILRPYGSVGPLPWQDENSVRFGEGIVNDHKRLFALSENIRTYTEQDFERVDKSGKSARGAIHDARIVTFLGFGFHQQNMNLIRVGLTQPWRRVFATGIGIDIQNYDDMKRYIAQTVGCQPDKVQLLDRSAHVMLSTMRPSLMATL